MLDTSNLRNEPDLSWLNELNRESRVALGGLLQGFLAEDQLQDYRAYPKQLEFHMLGRFYDNRMLRAGNQQGKTFCASAEFAMHVTGEYPPWWEGYRFDHPIVAWACGETAIAVRDVVQMNLLGLPQQIGTGMIPKRCLTEMFGRDRGAADLYDYYHIRHKSGGLSMVKFRYYAQERKTWQGPKVHLLWLDEEPPLEMYEEGLARTVAADGITMMTFTPLKGYSEVVNLYLRDPDPTNSGRVEVKMTLHDAQHISPEKRARKIAKWPKHQQRARVWAEPMLGEGLIFPYDEEDLKIQPFIIPDHWPRLGCLDFGIDHPTAAVMLVHDKDNDVVYVTREYRKPGMTPPEHWLTLKRWGGKFGLKWAWPRDGLQTEKGSGVTLAQLYRDEGANMMSTYSQFAMPRRKTRTAGSNLQASANVSVERGLLDMDIRMQEGGLRVFATCPLWFEEQRQYHRKDGKIVKKMDDIMDATRIGIMSLRFAEVASPTRFRNRQDHDWQAGV